MDGGLTTLWPGRRRAVIFGRFFAWWRGRRAAAHLRFVMYTGSGCHLCEAAHRELEAARRRHGFQLAIVDIATDADLVARHGEQVPVVTVNGKVRFRGGVNRVLLERLLRAERQRG